MLKLHQPQPMPSGYPALLIGNGDIREFHEAAVWLAANGAKSTANVDTALEMIQDGFCPAVIVLALRWPGQVTLKQIEALREASPLSRIVGLLGSWLEGERRTGRPWHPASRAYWHQWIPRHARAWKDSRTWAWPITAGEEEGAASSDDDSTPRQAFHCAIYAHYRDAAETLGEMCQQQGWTSAWIQHPDEAPACEVDVLLFDAMRGSEKEIETLSLVKSKFKDAAAIVLVGFPRRLDIEAWIDAGASAIVSKPYRVGDLLWEVDRVAPIKKRTV